MEELTIQAFLNEKWLDIAIISFPESDLKNYRITELNYISEYALEHFDKDDIHAVSINYPVSFFFDDDGRPGWLKFLDDIMPSGASRRYWVNRLNIGELSSGQQNFILLKFGTMAPVGNLRVKDSLPKPDHISGTLFFTIDDVKNRAGDFLDYAQHRGAAAGGATGAGGEAPKLLLRYSVERAKSVDSKNIWIDSYQNDNTNKDLHYLVKYPRGTRSLVDCNILRAEYYYYHELAAMGFDTIPVENMRLEEGLTYPSLWLPRFDVIYGEGPATSISRFGMESVYSILGIGPGVTLDHETTIRDLIKKITQSHTVKTHGFVFDIQAFVIEWVKRDLLNILFGNSDNHGRNTCFLKGDGFIKLSPIYDFAPMKADPEGIPRSTKWKSPLEVGGEYDFFGIAESLSDLVPSDVLLMELRNTAKKCLGLQERLESRGAPEQITNMPAIGLKFIPEKIKKWGLL